jgi:hypothetical protein
LACEECSRKVLSPVPGFGRFQEGSRKVPGRFQEGSRKVPGRFFHLKILVVVKTHQKQKKLKCFL